MYRTSLSFEGWPVELFVHTEPSLREFVAKDRARRRPTMARLVATGVPLLTGIEGEDLWAHCVAAVAAGAEPLSPADRDCARYFLTDLLLDLEGGEPSAELDAVAVEIWRRSAELLLAASGWLDGGGKWLVREIQALDAARGSSSAADLQAGLRAALAGDRVALVAAADRVLTMVGGRLWDGFRLSAN